MLDVAKFKPINKRVLLLKTIKADEEVVINGHTHYAEGGVILPDTFADNTCIMEVIDVADDCKIFSPESIDGLILAPELSEDFDPIDRRKGYWIAKEDVLPPFVLVG